MSLHRTPNIPSLSVNPLQVSCPHCSRLVDMGYKCNCGYDFTCELCGQEYDEQWEANDCYLKCSEKLTLDIGL